jgi:hypothetical protein
LPVALPFLQAVKEDWYFQMYYDDLPVWGFIGKMEKIIAAGSKSLYKWVADNFVEPAYL